MLHFFRETFGKTCDICTENSLIAIQEIEWTRVHDYTCNSRSYVLHNDVAETL